MSYHCAPVSTMGSGHLRQDRWRKYAAKTARTRRPTHSQTPGRRNRAGWSGVSLRSGPVAIKRYWCGHYTGATTLVVQQIRDMAILSCHYQGITEKQMKPLTRKFAVAGRLFVAAPAAPATGCQGPGPAAGPNASKMPLALHVAGTRIL